MTWHASADLLAAYQRGDTGSTENASLEAHLLACAECRNVVAAHAHASSAGDTIVDLDAVWSDITDTLDAPRVPFVERALHGMGVPGHSARLLAATPALRLSWIVAVTMATLVAVALSASDEGGTFAQLVIAPLLPPLAVALAYGPGIDPTHELGVATPMHGFRLILLRTIACTSVTIAAGLVSAIVLPWSWTAFAWLVPALAFAALTLAVRAYVPTALHAAAAIDATWLIALFIAQDSRHAGIEGVGPTTQATLAVVGIAAAAVVAARHNRIGQEVTS